MATLPHRLCKHPGCSKISGTNGYCDRHQRQTNYVKESYVRDKNVRSLYSRRWQKASKDFLAEHPWCVECLKHDIYIPATVVDHIIPHRGSRELFWDRNNWQSLCKHHHDQKTARGE